MTRWALPLGLMFATPLCYATIVTFGYVILGDEVFAVPMHVAALVVSASVPILIGVLLRARLNSRWLALVKIASFAWCYAFRHADLIGIGWTTGSWL